MTIDDPLSHQLELQAHVDAANQAISGLRYELNAANAAADVAEQKQAAAEAECERLRDHLLGMQKVQHDLFVEYERLVQRHPAELGGAILRLNNLRAELLTWKLTRRIDSTHSGNCKRPLLRIANAKARLERVRRMAATWQR